MTYAEAMEFIGSLPQYSPAFFEDGKAVYNLDSMAALLKLLDSPQKKLHFVHIAGTNGKGSTAAFMQQILIQSGLQTGLFTSPALERFTERIRVNRDEISETDMGRITAAVKAACEEMQRRGLRFPSQYEVVCAAALLYFAEQNCDIVVLETGLGGTFDATNVIDVPDLAVITTISMDHTAVLGKTLTEIAGAKAGIIKEGGTVLLYPQQEEAEIVFEEVCKKNHARLYRASVPKKAAHADLEGQYFDCIAGQKVYESLHIRLLGEYQIRNAAMAVNGAMILADKGWPVTEESVRKGLDHTYWPGRFELMQQSPAVIVDGGHNYEGAMALRKSLEQYFPGRRIHFVTGVLADKDYENMMHCILPLAESFWTLTPDNPRALRAEELTDWLKNRGIKANTASSVEQAMTEAMLAAGKQGIVCVFGSLSYLGDVRRVLN